MKKTTAIFYLILFAGMSIPGFASAGGGKFEGIIYYSISFPGTNIPEEKLAMMPKTSTLYVKGTATRNETMTPVGNVVVVSNYDKKFTVSLLDMMGKKMAIKKNLDEINKELSDQPKPSVKPGNETKEIAGYKCKKAIITISKNGSQSDYEIWYTDELGGKETNFGNPLYQDIDGMLMEFTFQERSITMKYTVTKVEAKTLTDTYFEIPPDYQLTTEAELRSMFGGGGN
jgi:GLPGLI family protein